MGNIVRRKQQGNEEDISCILSNETIEFNPRPNAGQLENSFVFQADI
jgi:hypothetical protein